MSKVRCTRTTGERHAIRLASPAEALSGALPSGMLPALPVGGEGGSFITLSVTRTMLRGHRFTLSPGKRAFLAGVGAAGSTPLEVAILLVDSLTGEVLRTRWRLTGPEAHGCLVLVFQKGASQVPTLERCVQTRCSFITLTC